MSKAPITNIIFGTMTLGYRGYGARVHDAATADAMLGAVLEFGHDQLDTCSVYGGAFGKNFAGSAAVAAGSRFDNSTAQGKFYRDRYWNDAYFDALAEIHRSCEGRLDAISVALRWLIHHSQLNAERNDGIIIGASSLEHLRHNLTAVTEGPLPTEVLAAIDDAALKAQPKWPPYFSGV